MRRALIYGSESALGQPSGSTSLARAAPASEPPRSVLGENRSLPPRPPSAGRLPRGRFGAEVADSGEGGGRKKLGSGGQLSCTWGKSGDPSRDHTLRLGTGFPRKVLEAAGAG